VIVVGVTGGIGSGKTAVTDLMAAHGALVVDADLIARDIVEPGEPAYLDIVETFGPEVVTGEGAIDRAALARVVFSDDKQRAVLNEITHPRINERIKEQIKASRDQEGICLVAIPLLGPDHRERLALDAVLVVDCPTEVAVHRLIEFRGFQRDDALARVASQIGRDERLAFADYVVVNDGSHDRLTAQIDSLFQELLARPEAHPRG
jgi:dephospho-CoA kinase